MSEQRPIVSNVTLLLPFPPSINRLWRATSKRVYRSREYTAWLNKAGKELNKQTPGRIDGDYSISVDLSPPDRRRRDLDNFNSKAISDLLTHESVIADDSHCRAMSARWVNEDFPCRVTVTRIPRA